MNSLDYDAFVFLLMRAACTLFGHHSLSPKLMLLLLLLSNLAPHMTTRHLTSWNWAELTEGGIWLWQVMLMVMLLLLLMMILALHTTTRHVTRWQWAELTEGGIWL